MWGSKHSPGLHGSPEAMQEPKVALVGCKENTFLIGCVLEMKWIASSSEAELHSSRDIMALIHKE
jgi:hypothetical protein